MKASNFDMVQMLNILAKYENIKLPQKISYAILKNLKFLQDEYKIYSSQLKQIYNSYQSYYVKDKNGEPQISQNGIPIVDHDHKESFDNEISELLNGEIDFEMHTINEDLFDYEDADKYDALTPVQISELIGVLCRK